MWHSLSFNLQFMPGRDKIYYSHILIGEIHLDLREDSVEQLNITKMKIGEQNEVSDTIFVDCSFFSSTFNALNFTNVTFVNCSFTA